MNRADKNAEFGNWVSSYLFPSSLKGINRIEAAKFSFQTGANEAFASAIFQPDGGFTTY